MTLVPAEMPSGGQLQTAHLVALDGQTLVATVEVPAFPGNPGVVLYAGRAFADGMVGYGVDYLTYREQTVLRA